MIVVDCPLNNLSFGNVSFNILRELYQRSEDVSLFLLGDSADFSAFDSLDPDFKNWIERSYYTRYRTYDKDLPSFKLWHLNGSIDHKTSKQNLFTFYECSAPTEAEIAIAKSQDHTFFSSSESKNLFESMGVTNCSFLPVGFDPDLKIMDTKRPNGVHFGLIGKLEYRKRTAEIIRAWLKKYGNKQGFYLNLLIGNPFLKPEDIEQTLQNIFEKKRYFNVNIMPHLKTNSEVCQLMNAMDIDLSGLSGGEGWNLPAFNSTCLGKWSIVSNHTSHRDWATDSNSILVEPDGEIECNDGIFFKKGGLFNQGHFHSISEDKIIEAMELAEKKVGVINTDGIALQEKFSYKNTVDKIMNTINASRWK